MPRIVDPDQSPGHNSTVMCPGRLDPYAEPPGTLELVTGAPYTAYRALTPDDSDYALFVDVWRLQSQWDSATHFTFWRCGLRVWPRSSGAVNQREMQASWVEAGRRHRLPDSEIAKRIGVELDSLRHNGALKIADEMAARERPWPRRWERAPLIVAVDHGETPPAAAETWWDPRLRPYFPESMQNAHEIFRSIARRGVRPGPHRPSD